MQQPPHLRDTLFGDLPLDVCAEQGSGIQPWLSFQTARTRLAQGDMSEACKTLEALTLMRGVESRYHLQAWHSLRELGRPPALNVAREVLGVVVEVGMEGGLDLLAAYADQTVHYYNYAGSGVVWKHPDASLDGFVDAVLDAARAILPGIGPWKDLRRAPPASGHVRLNILTPLGLHFGEGPFDLLDRDPMGRPLLQAATSLMRKLTALQQPTAGPARQLS